MVTNRRLNDSFTNWQTAGIFHYLAALDTVELPWTTDALTLDLDYHGGHSGDKISAPLVMKLRETDPDTGEVYALDASSRAALAAVIWNRFGDAWTKVWDALQTEYTPLDNYNMIEHEESSGGSTRTPNLSRTHSKTGQDSRQTAAAGDTDTVEKENSVYGFNSESAVPSDESSEHYTHTKNQTETGSASESGTDTETGTDNTIHSDERDLTRHGNIGVTTSQQMLQSEIDLRTAAIFFDIVYRDIDSILTLSIY